MSLCIGPTATSFQPPSPVFSEAVRRADPKNILRSGHIHPELARRIERLIEDAAGQGMGLYVEEGYRSPERQAQLIHDSRGVTHARPGYSFHNYGLAVDITFRNAKGGPSWSESHDWKKLGELGKKQGLFWGGDWKHPVDRTHFQLLPNDQISRVRQLTHEVGLQKMWERVR